MYNLKTINNKKMITKSYKNFFFLFFYNILNYIVHRFRIYSFIFFMILKLKKKNISFKTSLIHLNLS